MFGYRSAAPRVRLTTDQLVVRLVHERDAWRITTPKTARSSNPGSRCATKATATRRAGRRGWGWG
nr:ribosomal-protein-S5-alanine N-acetyltransferase [Candidatus Pantoea persica]